LGVGPFRWVMEFDRGARNHTTCAFCGTAIRYEEVIEDSRGQRFSVGNECVAKTGDSGLIKAVSAAEKARRGEQRAAKRRRQQQERESQHEAFLQAQRDRNGGKTDAEMEMDRIHAKWAKNRERNLWLSSVLRAWGGDFASSVARDLEGGQLTVAELPQRCLSICNEIFSKTQGGRRGSKAYEDASERFWAHVNADTQLSDMPR
jgi:hypothetical protein